ncbi:MAG: HAMP domain-containing histidine kinase [Elusimicrobiales bacterium]|nr:HAMP domain-containing histidine kinase [Elusimicrobiales bacterium]
MSKTKSFFAALIVLALIASVDFLSGPEVNFSFFYLVPAAFAAWRLDFRAGAAFSALGASLWFVMDNFVHAHVYSHPLLPYWNTLVRFLFFLSGAAAMSRLKKAMLHEQQLAQTNSEMVSIVSHELNNSLVSVQLAASLLQEDEPAPIDPKREKFYGILTQTNRNMAQTVRTFLNKARLESGSFKLQTREIEFRKLAREALAYVQYLAEEKKISLKTTFPETVIPVVCDPDAISLALVNLITNGIKYTPAGGELEVSLRREEGRPDHVEISVRDSGIGIPSGELEAIFSGFYRTQQGKKTAAGTGLGLKISKEFIEAHGSALKVESDAGKGARFYFSLPTAA